MKSFRGERQRKNASSQVFVAVLVLLTSILLANFLPTDSHGDHSETTKNTWESSVISIP